MTTVVSAARQLFGLFVDDWGTSAGVVVWLAIVAFATPYFVRATDLRSVLLFAGLAALLVASVAVGARERSS